MNVRHASSRSSTFVDLNWKKNKNKNKTTIYNVCICMYLFVTFVRSCSTISADDCCLICFFLVTVLIVCAREKVCFCFLLSVHKKNCLIFRESKYANRFITLQEISVVSSCNACPQTRAEVLGIRRRVHGRVGFVRHDGDGRRRHQGVLMMMMLLLLVLLLMVVMAAVVIKVCCCCCCYW